MEYKFSYIVGKHKGKTIRLHAALDEPKDPEKFKVSLMFFDRVKEENVEIARIDNSHPPLPAHLDTLWDEEKGKKELNWEGDTWQLFGKACDYLESKWKLLVDRWERKKG